MLRAAASLVWTRTENEHPVTKEVRNKCKWLEKLKKFKWSYEPEPLYNHDYRKLSTLWTEESLFFCVLQHLHSSVLNSAFRTCLFDTKLNDNSVFNSHSLIPHFKNQKVFLWVLSVYTVIEYEHKYVSIY